MADFPSIKLQLMEQGRKPNVVYIVLLASLLSCACLANANPSLSVEHLCDRSTKQLETISQVRSLSCNGGRGECEPVCSVLAQLEQVFVLNENDLACNKNVGEALGSIARTYKVFTGDSKLVPALDTFVAGLGMSLSGLCKRKLLDELDALANRHPMRDTEAWAPIARLEDAKAVIFNDDKTSLDSELSHADKLRALSELLGMLEGARAQLSQDSKSQPDARDRPSERAMDALRDMSSACATNYKRLYETYMLGPLEMARAGLDHAFPKEPQTRARIRSSRELTRWLNIVLTCELLGQLAEFDNSYKDSSAKWLRGSVSSAARVANNLAVDQQRELLSLKAYEIGSQREVSAWRDQMYKRVLGPRWSLADKLRKSPGKFARALLAYIAQHLDQQQEA